MSWRKREPVEPGFVPTPGDEYHGPHAFSEGFYYPILNDEHSQETGPDRSKPLRWVKDEQHPRGGYLVHAAPEDVNHFHEYGLNPAVIEMGEPE